METPNYYEERAKRTFSSAKPENENSNQEAGSGKNEIMDLIKNVGIDVGIAVVGGGAASAALGQYSFLAGVALTTYAHYEKSDKLRTLGIGLMASSSMSHCAKHDPKGSMTENMQERLKAFGKELKHKIFIDKLMQEKQATKNETKQADDLKGTEQKKTTASTTQNNQKSETTQTSPLEKTENPESEYLSPDNATAELSNTENEPVWGKLDRYKDEDFGNIAEKLY